LSGVGVDLDPSRADPESVRRAARLVFDTPRFRAREKMAKGFTAFDAEADPRRLIASLEV